MTHYSDVLRRVRLACFCLILVGAAISISLIGIASGLYAAVLAATLLTPSRSKLPAPPFLRLCAALIVVLLYSMFISDYPAQSWQGLWKYLLAYLAFYAAFETIQTPRERRWVTAWFMFCALTAALSGIGQDIIGRDFLLGHQPVHYTDAITRITGPFKHCNDFASFLLPAWMICIAGLVAAARSRKSARACWSFLAAALISWALARTMSRAAMIAAAAGLLFMIQYLPYRRILLSAMAAAGAAAWFVPSSFSHRLHKLLDLNVDMQERITLIKGTVKMIQDAPWFGLGLNTYSKWFPLYNPPDTTAPILMYAHNSYLQMMAEAGAVGLALYLVYLFLSVRRAASASAQEADAPDAWMRPALAAGVVALLVNALFESLLQSSQLRTLLWSVLGMALAIPAKSRR